MKRVYQLLVLGMLCLLSNTTHAQVLQYSDDGKTSFIDPEAKNASTERSCYCLAGIQLRLFNTDIQNLGGSEREKWLKEQEILLAVEITGVDYWGMYNGPFGLPSDYDFGKIQKDYFKNKETNRLANEYYSKVDEHLANVYNHDKEALQSSTVNSSILDIRKREGTVNPKYGDLKLNGQYLRNISDTDVNTNLNEQLNIRNTQRSTFLRYDESRSRLERSVTEGWVSDYLADQYLRHYNGLGTEDAIRFMTRYMVYINDSNSPLITEPFGNPDNAFLLEEHDYASRIAVVTDLYPTMENWTPREFSNVIDDDRVLYGLALNNLRPDVRSFISRTDAIDLSDVFKENRYPEGMLDRYDDTFVRYMNNTPFDGTFNGSIIPNSGSATNLPTDLGTELAYRFSFNDAGVAEGLRGFSNVLHDLFNLDDTHNALKGSYIKSFFNADGQHNLDFLSDEQVGMLLDFGTVYPWEGTHYNNFFLEYKDNEINRILLANNIRFLELLANPFIQSAVLALLDGGDVDFEDDIILDRSVGDCMTEIITQLKLKDTFGSINPDIAATGGTQHLSSFILDIFNENPEYSIIFKVAELGFDENNNEKNGSTVNTTTKVYTITIDEDLITKGTQLFIAKTIIHESMHAFLFYNNYDGQGTTIDIMLNQLYKKYQSESNANNLTQHEFMGQFVESYAHSLAAWDSHKQPIDYYEKLSWGGLEGSSAYKALPISERREIQQIINNERYDESNARGEKCP